MKKKEIIIPSKAEELAKYFQSKNYVEPIKRNSKENYSTFRDSLYYIEDKSTRESSKANLNYDNKINHIKKRSIKISKNISKHCELNLVAKSFIKLDQKFYTSTLNEFEDTLTTENQVIIENDNSILETEEKLSINELKELENKKIICLYEDYPFHILMQIEKLYKDLLYQP